MEVSENPRYLSTIKYNSTFCPKNRGPVTFLDFYPQLEGVGFLCGLDCWFGREGEAPSDSLHTAPPHMTQLPASAE